MNETTAEDRCRGVLQGLAAGDRNGGPIRMAVRVAGSLIDCGGFEPVDILGRYVQWWQDGAFDTGPVSARVLDLVSAGMPSQKAVTQVHQEFGGMTAGCNPAHRSTPLSMLAAISDERLDACAMSEARLTHHDPLAGEVAGAVNRLTRLLIRGTTWADAVPQIGELAKGEWDNRGGYAPDVLRAAAHFVNRSASFAEALRSSLAFAGSANYCPVLTGAIGGARWGAAAIPRSCLVHVELLPDVQAAAEVLAAGWREFNRTR